MCLLIRRNTAAAIAAFMAASVVLLTVLSASPEAHDWWHHAASSCHKDDCGASHDADSPSVAPKDEHRCGVTMWAAGIDFVVDVLQVAAPLCATDSDARVIYVRAAQPEGSLPFGRAPPQRVEVIA